MKVSIIIPAVADRGYLKAAIASAKNQRGIPNSEYEIILVSDGNPALQIFRGMDRVRYIQNPIKGGLSAAINFAIPVASGKYYTVLPDDDLLPTNAIKDLYDELERTGADFCHGNAVNFWDHGKEAIHKPKHTHPDLRTLVGGNCIHGGTTMYLRTAHIDVGGWSEDLWTGEEFEFHLKLLAAGKKIAYVPKVVFKYRQHTEQKSTKGKRGSEYHNKRVKCIEGFRSKYRKMI